jgi:uncharacterized membrane protein
MVWRELLLGLSVFAASSVEAVEALTIVLAVGTTRGWRSTVYGVLSALVVLAVIVAALGPALTVLPIGILRLVVGGLLLIFGLQWLRKAMLRASGLMTLRDEAKAYAKARTAAQDQHDKRTKNLVDDWYSFTVAFKGVLLEGLEVAFIVITFIAQGSSLVVVSSAALAILVVVAVGLAVRAPLTKVPENVLKYGVGIMLTSFGTFWSLEGLGLSWPGSDAAILGLIVFYALTSLVGLRLLTTTKGHAA